MRFSSRPEPSHLMELGMPRMSGPEPDAWQELMNELMEEHGLG
ncbi:MAG: hypothetical protein OXC57_08660 [Rhodobacteraceae bacterium]|nr:hypothetical protein [Paracoccaceae bacterium]